MLTDAAARWLLVVHTGLGVAAVGAATHLVLWLRRYVRGQAGRRRAVVRFAWLVLALQLGALTCGLVMYPTYKVEVRAAYLENPDAIAAIQAVHRHALDQLAAREGTAASEPEPTIDVVRGGARAARWFDVKEHWVALGTLVSAALVLVLSLWDPREGGAVASIVVGLAGIAAGSVWLAAIIGGLTASWRAV